jgi:hypothetical protein
MQHFANWICFHLHARARERERPTLFGFLERHNLKYWISYLEFWTMDEAHKPSGSEAILYLKYLICV